jgi:thioredoxin 1
MRHFYTAGVCVLTVAALAGCKPTRISQLPINAAPIQQEQSAPMPPAPATTTVIVDTGSPMPTVASTYLPFSKAAYDQARADRRPIVLFFYANWCPTCRVQEPIMQEVYASGDIAALGVQAFRVNFNDPETDADERALAESFRITYQHTFVMLNVDGQEVARSFGHRNRDQVMADAAKAK